MREPLLVFGLFAGFGIAVIAAWMTLAGLSGGALPGAGPVSVMGPVAAAAMIVAGQCILSLVRGEPR